MRPKMRVIAGFRLCGFQMYADWKKTIRGIEGVTDVPGTIYSLWRRLAIAIDRIKPGKPQQNGRHEGTYLPLIESG